ncbi:sensor histidine kinase [Clavibacter michiganensis]|uniref:sensor histidine kinase n=1 Tax=Clavibacter michiganensis TaxID=28447 RepID=UPI0005B787FF|nr:histidine kinase [Clavibacter michiganensis]
MTRAGRLRRWTTALPPARYGRDDGFSPLPVHARIALLALVAVVLVFDLVGFIEDPASSWRELVAQEAPTAALALFAWSPSAAAVSLLLAALLETAGGEGGGLSVYLVVAAGLVVYTSPLWFIAFYGVATTAVLLLHWSTAEDLTSSALPVVLLIGALAALVGWSLRSSLRRERGLAVDLLALERARDAELESERQRIADELHDIIAHDVTLVAMHVRVLERVDDPALRAQSIVAIRDSADQALADIRRVLRVVRDDRSTTIGDRDEDGDTLAGAVVTVRRDLEALGAHVVVGPLDGVDVSSAIERTIVRLLREAATNIAKHAASRPEVHVEIDAGRDDVTVTISSTMPPAPAASPIPSSGYGVHRMRERVTLLGGSLDAREVEGSWVLSAQLPRH